jgi:HEAT repeat protein
MFQNPKYLIAGKILPGLQILLALTILAALFYFYQNHRPIAQGASSDKQETITDDQAKAIEADLFRVTGDDSTWDNSSAYAALDRFLANGNDKSVRKALRDAANGSGPGKVLALYALFRLRDHPEDRLQAILDTLPRQYPPQPDDMTGWTASEFLKWRLDPKEDAAYVPIMLKYVTSGDSYDRSIVLEVLAKHFHCEPGVFDAAVNALQAQCLQLRVSAAYAVGFIGQECQPFDYSVIQALLSDPDTEVRIAALSTLSACSDKGKAMEALQVAAVDQEADVREQVPHTLGLMDPTEIGLDLLIKGLDDPDSDVQLFSMRTLGNWGPFARLALPKILPFLQSEGNGLYIEAADSMAHIGFEYSMIEPILRSSVVPLRAAAVKSLRGCLEKDKAYKALKKAANDRDATIRKEAISAVGIMGPTEDGYPILINALQDPDKDVRSSASSFISDYGPLSRSALPKLLPLLQSEDSGLSAASAIASIGFEYSLIEPQLHDSAAFVRAAAVSALWGCTDKDKALDALKTAAADPEADIRLQAMKALGSMEATEDGLALLTRGLQDSDRDVCLASIISLGNYGPFALPALPKLESFLHSDDSGQNLFLSDAIGKILNAPE